MSKNKFNTNIQNPNEENYKTSLKNVTNKMDMVVHNCNVSTWEARVSQVPGQPGLQ
jgi:hypothetical protein